MTIVRRKFTNARIVNLLELCERRGFLTSVALAKALRISRQAAHRRLAAAVAAGQLRAEGHARARRYLLAVPTFQFALAGANEDVLFGQVRAQLSAPFAKLTREEMSVVSYAFAEMVNNAIDHSHGNQLRVRLEIDSKRITLEVVDDGIGAFESVRAGFSLRNHIEAAAEITKGKVTTMRSRHSGEGVFFTSKVADHFVMSSNGVELVVDNEVADHAIREIPLGPGTKVRLRVSRPLLRTLPAVFDEYTHEFSFTRTRTVVKLFGLGRDFMARSEARRILQGLDAFEEIVVDFTGVEMIGQGFADEMFRVFAQHNPAIRMIPVNMVDAVRFFVERAERARGPSA